MSAKQKKLSSHIEITGMEKYANIIIGNIRSTDFIVENVDRYIVYLFRSANIEYLLKLKNEIIVT